MQQDRSHSNYIGEVDTVRALAVALVVLFHYFPDIFRGGYIGVDVFFVVSGFVISRSYLEGMTSGRIGIKDFYLARFRRLAPALAVVLLVTSIAAILLLWPSDLIRYGRSLFSQPIYLQNFYFWNEGDYFYRAELKPLLHTWSLAVEEQFYIAWSLILLMRPKRPVNKAWFYVLFSILFFLSIYSGYLIKNISPKTVFYLIPFRAWELMAGIAAYLVLSKVQCSSSPVRRIAAALCLIAVVACGIVPGGRFPDLQAIVACSAIAVALVIFDRKAEPFRGFSPAPIRYIGRISYGLYLWHWPPIAFWYLKYRVSPSPVESMFLIAIAILFAALSFTYVEQPIRQRRFLGGPKNVFGAVALSSSSLIAVSIVFIFSEGALFLYPRQVRPFFQVAEHVSDSRCPKIWRIWNPRSEMCPISQAAGEGGILLLGDSHADMLKKIVGQAATETRIPSWLAVRNCDLGAFGSNALEPFYCNKTVLKSVLAQAKDKGVGTLMALSLWKTSRITEKSFAADVEAIVGAGFRLIVLQDIPVSARNDPVARAIWAVKGGTLERSGMKAVDYENEIQNVDRIFRRAADLWPEKVSVIEPAQYFCPNSVCKYLSEDGTPYYVDADHLSPAGQEVLRPMFDNIFKSLAACRGKSGRSCDASAIGGSHIMRENKRLE
ncbi:acyltransferase family protein [Consotaella aegiceratis]|uniref:acyltransferase family protein n=1 Tax=Consotaella aegiceratis TaxID=3097961 RepID=UPI002F4209AD